MHDPLKFKKCCQPFIGPNDKPLPVAAMRVSHEDRSPFGITAETQPKLHPALLRLSVVLLIVVDHLRRRFARFKLCAHLLQACSKRFNLLLLIRRRRL